MHHRPRSKGICFGVHFAWRQSEKHRCFAEQFLSLHSTILLPAGQDHVSMRKKQVIEVFDVLERREPHFVQQ